MTIHIESADLHVHHDGAGNPMPWWRIAKTVTATDGSSQRVAHLFPPDTMEWRAAEYGIDPADADGLLRIVLYEPHLAPLGVPDHMHASTLHNAPSIGHARAFHLSRVDEAAARHPLTVAPHATLPGRDVLHEVRTTSPLHPSVIAAKAGFVAQARATERERRARNVASPHHTRLPEQDRLAHLLRTMNPRHHHHAYGATDG